MASNSKNLGELLNTDNNLDRTELDFVSGSGQGSMDLPHGTTAQRPTAAAGMIRYNSTLNLAEYYNGTEWKAIDTPPSITNVTPSNFNASGTTITVTGSNFQSGVTAKLQGTDGTDYAAASTTRANSSSITFDTTADMVTDNDPFKVVVTNSSGLSATYESIYYAVTPAWSTAAGSLGTYYNHNRTGLSYTVAATSTDADDTITYAITSGALPSGLSLNTSTGAITGDGASVSSSTTYSFTITATATGEGGTTNTAARAFTLTNGYKVITSFTSTGSGTYSVPSGVSSLEVLVVAGGGGGGSTNGGGGGAGGLVYAPAFPVTPGGSVSYFVGGGGDGADARNGSAPTNQSRGGTGGQSTFGQLTAYGGGGGGSGGHATNSYAGEVGNPGGSGGGGSSSDSPGQSKPGGSGTQPGQGAGHPSGQGFGNDGGNGGVRAPHTAGGGGGAGGAGANAAQNSRNNGGVGKTYSISGSSVGYAGGGGGYGSQQGQNDESYWSQGSSGGGNAVFTGDIMNNPVIPQGRGYVNGVANRGGGGGGIPSNINEANSPAPQNGTAGNGGSGLVIVSY